MIYSYNGTDIHYKFVKKSDSVVNVFLHGWDRDLKDFDKITHALNRAYLSLDFPPFGLSGKVADWSVYTYAYMVVSLCRYLKIKKINLIGHSFGGRIAIIISAMDKELVNKLVLIDSAGMKPKRGIRYRIKLLNYKLRRKMGLSIEGYGSPDYKKLDDDMKKIFNNIVNTHLEDTAKLIKCKTLIIFGSDDQQTPLYMAKRLNKLISDSRLIIMKNCAHFCFLERPIMFHEILSKFLKEA